MEIGETTNLAVLQSHYAVNLDQARGPASVATHNWVGQLTPLHCTALHCTSSGKVLLAYLPPEDLRLARSRGFAVAIEEHEVGLNSVAAPIRGRAGEVVAAVSASGPDYRFGADRMREVSPVLLAGAAEIGRRLGFFD